jgi:hypothetical protein
VGAVTGGARRWNSVIGDLWRENFVKVGDWSMAPSFVFWEITRFLIAWVGD